MPDLDPALQGAALTLLRLLAQGEPVDMQRLAGALAQPAAYVDQPLERQPGVLRDDQGRIVGFIGLSVAPISDHRLQLDGRSLWAWCAWDTLFLPELLGQTARVSSRCPSTGAAISLAVTPNGPAELEPPETVVSFLVPEHQFDANVLHSFCHYVHFFASPDAAARWTAEHSGTFQLSIDDAYRLGHLTNRATAQPLARSSPRQEPPSQPPKHHTAAPLEEAGGESRAPEAPRRFSLPRVTGLGAERLEVPRGVRCRTMVVHQRVDLVGRVGSA